MNFNFYLTDKTGSEFYVDVDVNDPLDLNDVTFNLIEGFDENGYGCTFLIDELEDEIQDQIRDTIEQFVKQD